MKLRIQYFVVSKFNILWPARTQVLTSTLLPAIRGTSGRLPWSCPCAPGRKIFFQFSDISLPVAINFSIVLWDCEVFKIILLILKTVSRNSHIIPFLVWMLLIPFVTYIFCYLYLLLSISFVTYIFCYLYLLLLCLMLLCLLLLYLMLLYLLLRSPHMKALDIAKSCRGELYIYISPKNNSLQNHLL